jgi:hypothetical protein
MLGEEQRRLRLRSGGSSLANRGPQAGSPPGVVDREGVQDSARRDRPILSPVSRALVIMLAVIPSTEVLGYFRNVRFADEKPVVTVQDNDRKPGEIKVLAEGSHSRITNPFVAVVRDAETHAALLKLDGNLPKLDEEFFKSNTIVAVFLGERNTGGYSVEITREGTGGIRVAEKVPGKGVMVPQMITSPFKIVAVERGASLPVLLALDDTWRQEMQSYRVTAGKFGAGGGFAAITEHFGVEGEVRVIREQRLLTFSFDIYSSGSERKRSLVEFATGEIKGSTQITIHKMSAGSLLNSPNSGLQATGAFTIGDKKLSLTFTSLPSYISDAYGGAGSIEAEAAVSAPKT